MKAQPVSDHLRSPESSLILPSTVQTHRIASQKWPGDALWGVTSRGRDFRPVCPLIDPQGSERCLVHRRNFKLSRTMNENCGMNEGRIFLTDLGIVLEVLLSFHGFPPPPTCSLCLLANRRSQTTLEIFQKNQSVKMKRFWDSVYVHFIKSPPCRCVLSDSRFEEVI